MGVKAAAGTVIEAKRSGDFTEKSLSVYTRLLKQSFVLQDLETFKRAPLLLENPRLYNLYPELFCDLAEKIFRNDGNPKKKVWELFRDSRRSRVSLWQMIHDLFQIKRAL